MYRIYGNHTQIARLHNYVTTIIFYTFLCKLSMLFLHFYVNRHFAQKNVERMLIFMELYQKIYDLCQRKGISINKMCDETDIWTSAITNLKKGRANTLSADKLAKIANYFNVSVDYLLGNNENKGDAELRDLLEELRSDPDKRMLFSIAKGATAAEIREAVEIIEAIKRNRR